MAEKTDRELLELAAKATGHQFDSTEPFEIFVPDNSFGNNWCEWNPLTDDGDALRLAVKLGHERLLVLRIGPGGTEVGAIEGITGQIMLQQRRGEPFDHAAAVRRVIVRAAAEIGKAMP